MIAEAYLNNCGLALDSPLENRDFLEVACGAGSLSAAMLPHPAVRNCTFHAFDISPHGPEMLARFACTVNSSNLLELSVQDARGMLFDDSTFDVIWGNSVLHHLDDLAGFLTDCKRILKPGGVLTFGEPFAVGYGLGYAVLKIAQVQLGTQYESLDNAYNGIARRIKSRGDEFAGLVDKHLFFQPAVINLGRQIGFESVNLFSVPSYHYYQNSFIDALLTGMRISDSCLAQAGKELYRTIVDLFDADSLVYSLGAFMQIAMRA
jgi:ubiquinone/menaquinone biosynthesis C-methylase UbiE